MTRGKKKEDLKLGDTFYNYTVVSTPFYIGKFKKVKLQCKCGRIKTFNTSAFGRSKGCAKCANHGFKKSTKYYIGKQHFNLKIVDHIYYNGNIHYVVQCDCGSPEYAIPSRNIKQYKKCQQCMLNSRKTGTTHTQYKGTKNVSKTYFSTVKKHAKHSNYDFLITIDDMQTQYELQHGLCNLSHMPIIIGNNKIETTASLDRIDSSKGYIKDNIQWLHKDINRMKSDFDQNYYIKMCQLVANIGNDKLENE